MNPVLLLPLLLAGACLTAQAVEPARAEQIRAELRKRFSAADTNADARLSRDEAKAGMPMVYRNFDTIDTGRSGLLTVEQIEAYALKQRVGR